MGGRTLDQFNSRQQARVKGGKRDKDAGTASPDHAKDKSQAPLQPK